LESNQIHRTAVSQERIISEAIDLAKEDGWNKVTVRAIAGRLKYQPPVLYQFFKNKEELLQMIAARGFDLLTANMRDAADAEDLPEDKLLAFAMARFRFSVEEQCLQNLMFSTAHPCWHKEMIFSSMARTRNLVEGLIKNITKRQDDCSDLITNFIALTKGYTFFATELPAALSQDFFFGNSTAEDAFLSAMKHFINSIKRDG